MLKSLLARALLPREVPPFFTSLTLSNVVGMSLPANFTAAKAPWTQPVHHNLARPGGLRRRLTIPNPVSFFRLASAFQTHGALLQAEWVKSPFSMTTPTPIGPGPRAIANHPSDRAAARARARVGARYLLRADISQFYPSIYTHSIPWALHTKAVAKAQMKNPLLPGNIVDRELQASQFGQTKGIGIGPDTSLGIAELLMSPLDKRLDSACNILGGTRFIDDIELTFRRLSDADDALARLESLLNEFELQLNATKTKICELPDQIESVYVSTLRAHLPKDTDAPQSQWIDYFNTALIAARNQAGDGVLRYAVAALQGIAVSSRSWSLVQSLLWQCISADPGCLRFVVDVLLINKLRGLTLDVHVAETAVNSLIQSSAPVGHGSEVVWSIWAAMILGVPISVESQTAVSFMDDAMVACAAMVAKGRNVFAPAFDSPLWASWIVEDSFDQDHWIFVYESLKRGWFPSQVSAANLPAAVCPAFLVGAGVTFIDESIIAAYLPPRLLVSAGSAGGGGY